MAWHPFRNFGLKIVALGLGTLLWFTVSGQQANLAIVGVPIVYRNKPANMELTEHTELVNIHVRGLDSQLRIALPRDFEARVDLTGVRPGEQTFVLRTDQISAPPGVEVTQVDPGSVTATLELSGSKSVEVLPAVDGIPAPGFVVSRIASEPSAVTVTGPARRVAATTAATTDRVSIDGARDSVTHSVSVGVVDSLLRLRESTTARVTVTIEPSGERSFATVRVTVKNLAAGSKATVEPNVVSVLLRGPQTMLARLDARLIGPYVDVKGLGPGRHEVPVLFDLGGRLTIAEVRPSRTVTVIIN
jgi:YbbR domain-containing protein